MEGVSLGHVIKVLTAGSLHWEVTVFSFVVNGYVGALPLPLPLSLSDFLSK